MGGKIEAVGTGRNADSPTFKPLGVKMNTDAVEHAAQVGDAQDKYNDAMQAAELLLERAYLALCKHGDAKAVIKFAPLDQVLDYNRGPSTADMLQIVLDAANGANVEPIAVALRNRMAKTYATYNVDTQSVEKSLQ